MNTGTSELSCPTEDNPPLICCRQLLFAVTCICAFSPILLLLNLSPLGAQLLAATQQLLPLALRPEQLQTTELVAISPYAEGVSVMIQLDPVEPWKPNSLRPGVRLYTPQVSWVDELIDPLPLPVRELTALQELALGAGLIDDHEAVAVQSLSSAGLLVADVIDGLILNRRDAAHAQALAQVCEPETQRQLVASCCSSNAKRPDYVTPQGAPCRVVVSHAPAPWMPRTRAAR